MSTMVQMPVRVKPPPAEIGETISPGWAALTEVAARHLEARLADPHLPLGVQEVGVGRVVGELGVLDRLVAEVAAGVDLLIAPPLGAGLVRLRLGHLLVGQGRLGLGLSLSEAGAGVAVIEPGDDLAGLDVLAFLDEHLGDLAGDLAGDGGLAAGDDVAGGVQQRGALHGAAAGRGGLGGGDGDRDAARLSDHQIGDETDGEDRGEHAAGDPPHAGRRAASVRAGASIDLKLIQQRDLIHRRNTSHEPSAGPKSHCRLDGSGMPPRPSLQRYRSAILAC
jgi:hypothetical protein